MFVWEGTHKEDRTPPELVIGRFRSHHDWEVVLFTGRCSQEDNTFLFEEGRGGTVVVRHKKTPSAVLFLLPVEDYDLASELALALHEPTWELWRDGLIGVTAVLILAKWAYELFSRL